MTTALFDIITGISGDMTIAALIDAGADFEHLKNEINKLGLHGFELKLSTMQRSYITSKKFDVIINEQPNYDKHLADIFEIIESSLLSDFVKHTSKKMFGIIGDAEAKIHNVPIDKIHFHEVGAIDSFVDIVGTCICLEYLGVDKVYTTQVKLGKGQINTQHGIMPNPAPATLEILKDYPVHFTNIDFELTTPTGAAIVKSLSSGIYDNGSIGDVKIKKIGFGSGTFDIKESPNLLRVILCEVEFPPLRGGKEGLLVLETNIDDMNPQIYPYVMEKLFEAGAFDVYYSNIMMKKGRPGILLSVSSDESLLDKMLEIIYSETTTIGVRINKIERHKLKREIKEVETSFGIVKVKIAEFGNSENHYKITPEFEECKRLAKEFNKPLYEIYNKLVKEINEKT